MGLVPMKLTHVNADRQRVGEQLLSCLDVDVPSRRRRCRVEVRVMRREFTTEGVHPPRDLAIHLVTPAERRKVCLVVHEARVEERFLVWVGRLNVNLATAGRVFLKSQVQSEKWL